LATFLPRAPSTLRTRRSGSGSPRPRLAAARADGSPPRGCRSSPRRSACGPSRTAGATGSRRTARRGSRGHLGLLERPWAPRARADHAPHGRDRHLDVASTQFRRLCGSGPPRGMPLERPGRGAPAAEAAYGPSEPDSCNRSCRRAHRPARTGHRRVARRARFHPGS